MLGWENGGAPTDLADSGIAALVINLLLQMNLTVDTAVWSRNAPNPALDHNWLAFRHSLTTAENRYQ